MPEQTHIGDREQEPYFYATEETLALVPLEMAIRDFDFDGPDDITVDARHLRTILEAYRKLEKQSRPVSPSEALPEWVEDEIDGVRRLLEERPNFPKGVRRATAYLADESATLREQIGLLTRDLAVRDGHVDALESQLSAAREDSKAKTEALARYGDALERIANEYVHDKPGNLRGIAALALRLDNSMSTPREAKT